jgi:hypothetical protein
MANLVPLEQVPVSFDRENTVIVCNPLVVDFECQYGGKDVILKSGEMKQWPETKSAHVAKHLAIFILNNRSTQFLQKTFVGLNEKGQPKWKMTDAGFWTRQDVNELAKNFLVYDYEVGEAKPGMPGVKTKFDNPSGVETKPMSEQAITQEDVAKEKKANASKKAAEAAPADEEVSEHEQENVEEIVKDEEGTDGVGGEVEASPAKPKAKGGKK